MKNNAEIIKGINMTITGLETIKSALADGAEETATAEAPKSKSVARREKAQAEEPMNPPVETEGSAEAVTGKFDVEQLKAMKYNDLRS